jgi:predicted Zn-dependent peptidase
MKIKKASDEYIEKAKNLTEEEVEKLQSRMRGKLTRRAEDKKVSLVEALAIQLELDDEQLAEWRENIQAIRKKDKK